MVFGELTAFWKAVKQTHISGDIGTTMYWYLTSVIAVLGGIYLYLYYMGCVGLLVIANIFLLGRPSDVPFTLLNAVGIVLVLRYGFMSAIESLKVKPPQNLENRLVAVEQKMDRLYKMAVDPDFDPQKEGEIV